LRVGRIEEGDDLPDLHRVAEPHAPLDDLARDAKRQRRRIARLNFARQRRLRGLSIRMDGDGDDGARCRGGGDFLMTGGKRERAACGKRRKRRAKTKTNHYDP
jgi:hypothetical protein